MRTTDQRKNAERDLYKPPKFCNLKLFAVEDSNASENGAGSAKKSFKVFDDFHKGYPYQKPPRKLITWNNFQSLNDDVEKIEFVLDDWQ